MAFYGICMGLTRKATLALFFVTNNSSRVKIIVVKLTNFNIRVKYFAVCSLFAVVVVVVVVVVVLLLLLSLLLLLVSVFEKNACRKKYRQTDRI